MMNAKAGRSLWAELHGSITASSIEIQIRFFCRWINEVYTELGCVSCTFKLRRFMTMWPVDYGENFNFWGICLHDYVNKELGKPLFHPELTLAPLKERGIIQ